MRVLATASLFGASCSALIVPDDLDAEAGTAPATEDEATSDTDTGPPPHALAGGDAIDCVGATELDSCSLAVDSTAIACELNCEMPNPCPDLSVAIDLDSQTTVEPVDMTTLACFFDALIAGVPAYLEWTELGTGESSSSQSVYRAWILRPEEAVLAHWYESTVDGNIGEFGQTLQASAFDQLQLVDCQNETQGADRYDCLLEALRDFGCQGFGSPSCD